MKKILTITLALILSISLIGCDLLGGEDETTVTMETTTVDYTNVIDISTAQELQDMELNKSYRLVADIDLTDFDWTPIGGYETPFLGNFNGNGCTISNLNLTTENTIYGGLFGKLYGDVIDLTLEDFTINYQTNFLTYVGALAGYTEGDVENVVVTNATISINNTESNSYVGLLVGYSQPRISEYESVDLFVANEITNNTSDGEITLVSEMVGFVGGLIGKSFNSYVGYNEVEADLMVTFDKTLGYVGGLIGHNQGGILYPYEDEVDNIYNYLEKNIALSTIDVVINKNQVSIGGLAGYNHESFTRDNYSDTVINLIGIIDETTEVNLGDFFGEAWGCNIENNVALSDIINSLSGEYTLRNALFAGFNTGDIEWVNNYLVTDVLKAGDAITGLTNTVTTEALESSFFTSNLSWPQSFIDRILS